MARSKKTMPKVSVIVRAQGAFRAAWESILAQELTDIEVICVSDNAADGKRLKRYARGEKRLVFVSAKGGGEPALNAALSQAAGEYVVFWDTAHVYDPRMLADMRNRARHTGADIVSCRFRACGYLSEKDAAVGDVFNCRDSSRHFFQIVGREIPDKMFRRAFLKEQKIAFREGGIAAAGAVLAAAAAAEKISLLNREYIAPAPAEEAEGAAVPSCDERAGDVCATYLELQNFLRKKGVDGLLRQSFSNEALDAFREDFEAAREPAGSFKLTAFQECAKAFGLNDWGEAFYYPELWDWWQEAQRQVPAAQRLQAFFEATRGSVIPIVFAANDAYAPFACVAIQSVLEQAREGFFYDIYVLHTALSRNLMEILESMGGPNSRVRCLSVSKHLPENAALYSKAYYSPEMYYRWLIPELLAYEKVLYLDCDVIALDDVGKLYREELGDDLVAGVKNYANPPFQDYIRDKLKLDPLSYVNTGVLLMNAALLKEEGIARKCFEALAQNKELNCPDQDALNLVCRDRIKVLSPVWNCLWQPVITGKHAMPAFSEMETDSWHEASFRRAKILHYNTAVKPWTAPENDLAEKFWLCARKTPVYEAIIDSGIRRALKDGKGKAEDPEKAVLEGLDGMQNFNKLFGRYLKSWALAKLSRKSKEKRQKELENIKSELNRQYKRVIREIKAG